MENQKQKYLTEKQVHEFTGIALSTLRNHRFENIGIPYIKLGRSVRYSFIDVVEYLESRKIKTENIF